MRAMCLRTVSFFYVLSISTMIYADISDTNTPDTITIYNNTPDTIFVAPYYKQDKPHFLVTRVDEPRAILSHQQLVISRPERLVGYDRRLLFSKAQDDLHVAISGLMYQKIGRVAIGTLQGSKFYINEMNGVLIGLNLKDMLMQKLKSTLDPVSSVYKKAESLISMLVESTRKKVIKHPYTDVVAHTRIGSTLSEQEQKFRHFRQHKIANALFKLTKIQVNNAELPTIAICGSGGGYRAMIEMIGSLEGAHVSGILDACMYMSGLSGSTWAILPLAASNLTIDDYRKQLRDKTAQGITIPSLDGILDIARRCVEKKIYGQSVHVLDIYGALLANALLKGFAANPQAVTFTTLQHNLEKNHYPLPIATALETSGYYSKWFEFTPFEIGSYNMNAYVPSWGFGRVFDNGISTNFAPAQNLGFYLGVCGSAFAINNVEVMNAMLEKLINLLPPLSFLKTITDEISTSLFAQEIKSVRHALSSVRMQVPIVDIGMHPFAPEKNRLFAANIPNITYNMPGQSMSDSKWLYLVDGAHEVLADEMLNVGLMPLLRHERMVDIIIICDAGAHFSGGAEALSAAVTRARRDGFKLPYIDIEKATNNQVSVFSDKNDPQVPVIIYIPGIKNPGYSSFDPAKESWTNTANFTYSPEQFNQLCGLAMYNFFTAKPVIVDAIRAVIAAKRRVKLRTVVPALASA